MHTEDDFDIDEVEALLEEAAESGEPILLTEAEWDAMLREARALADSRRRER